MENYTAFYWTLRNDSLCKALTENNFEAYPASSAEEASKILFEKIIPGLGAKTVAWGGSQTVVQTGIYNRLKSEPGIHFLNPFESGLTIDESYELRRKALVSDLFVTGSNALTQDGILVNLDRTGNRVSAVTFGPKDVVIVVGRNKIVKDLGEAKKRIKDLAAPLTAMRIKAKVPCVRTGRCEDCSSPERLCNVWSIIEKSYPEGRIKIIIIDGDFGH